MELKEGMKVGRYKILEVKNDLGGGKSVKVKDTKYNIIAVYGINAFLSTVKNTKK